MAGVRHQMHDLADDMDRDVDDFALRAARAVRDVAEDGNTFAKNDARVTAGRRGKNYPKAFSTEPLGPFTVEWGPDADHPGGQGGMDFEHGRGRQSRPHHNIAKGADRHGAADLARRVAGPGRSTLPYTFK